MTNVISALKIMNGISAEDVKFHWPTELDVFSETWKRTQKLGITSMSGFQKIVPDELVVPFTKEEILSKYLEGKDAGYRRFHFEEAHLSTQQAQGLQVNS